MLCLAVRCLYLAPMNERTAGVLAHPTSLTGVGPIGDLGPGVERFLDWAAAAGFRTWQILPLAPLGPGHSPYASPSAFAGNPLLISPEKLVAAGWLDPDRVRPVRAADRVDYRAATIWKAPLLRACHREFQRRASVEDRRAFEAFQDDESTAAWLQDWAVFAALRRRDPGKSWLDWHPAIRDREFHALKEAIRRVADEIEFQRFLQFVFDRQWGEVAAAARSRGLAILGDVPFYVSHESADVWAGRERFRLDASGRPTAIAGVPPDYFSEDGQLWGNPLYDWQRQAEDRFDWWVRRLRANLRHVDRLRLDHFRAFSAYWEVDAAAETAIDGHWSPGPGAALLEQIRRSFPEMPFVAEDLGDIDDPVRELRDRFSLPGMRVLQFGWTDDTSTHHPKNHIADCVAYTGTHDNDTMRGWLDSLETDVRERLLRELGTTADQVARVAVDQVLASPATTAILPLQDLLELGGEARMNRPGLESGNWNWRVDASALTEPGAVALRERIGRHRG